VPDAAIRAERLDNGLVLVAEPMTRVRSAAFTMFVPAGAAFEPEGRAGAASIVAEWVTRGAGDLDSRGLLAALDDLGVSHGESAHTVHASLSAATLGANLVPALGLFADILMRPRLDDDEVEPIRALALQGLQSLEDDPASKVMVELRRRHFPDPWGRSSSGRREGLESVTADELRAFHGGAFRPNGAILGVAGALDWDELRAEVSRLFDGWEPRPEPPVVEHAAGPARDHVSQETQQTQVAVAYPAPPVGHDDYYACRAAAAILGGYASARLFTEVREKRGLCYSVYAGYEGLRDRGAVIAYAGTSNERAQETLDVTLAEIRRLAAAGVDRAELDMMRAGLKSSLVMQQESSTSRSSALASDWYYLGRVRPLEEIAAALDALTPASVGAFAASQPLDRMTLLTLGPKPLEFPTEAATP